MYNNPNWKWVIPDHDKAALETDRWFMANYKLRKVMSFSLSRLINYNPGWRLTVQAHSKIQKWIASRLSLERTRYTNVYLTEEELKLFLDELDQMMEILYAKA